MIYKLFSALVWLLLVTPASALTSYHIGNSLTWDSRPDYGTPKLATDAGLSLTTGYHIRCSSSLDYISQHPTNTCVTPNNFGFYGDALANNTWDAVTLQPFSSTATPSTPRTEYEGAKALIQQARLNPNNANTTFYIYTGWMSRTDMGDDFYAAWYDDTPVDPDEALVRKASSFEWVYDELANDPDLAGVDLQMIPVGDALAELDRRMSLGQVPGFSGAEGLYRDDLHLNNLGWFVASNTVLSTLFKFDPTGTPTNNAFTQAAPGQGQAILITPELRDLIQGIVWDVVRFSDHTGFLPGDLDGDGFVGIGDLNVILSNWNTTQSPPTVGDLTGDGFVGIADLNIVLGNWNTLTAPALVPEPSSLILLGLLLCGRSKHARSSIVLEGLPFRRPLE